MSITILYRTSATATGGREGSTSLDDGSLTIRMVPPSPKADTDGHNPEQLFAAGYAACFLSAAKMVADKMSMPLTDEAHVTASVGIGTQESGGYGFEIELKGDFPGLTPNHAVQLMKEAHGVCPYSNAIRGNVDVRLTTV